MLPQLQLKVRLTRHLTEQNGAKSSFMGKVTSLFIFLSREKSAMNLLRWIIRIAGGALISSLFVEFVSTVLPSLPAETTKIHFLKPLSESKNIEMLEANASRNNDDFTNFAFKFIF